MYPVRGESDSILRRAGLKEGDETQLELGMTFSVEPTVYVPAQYAIQIEDTVVVTDAGCESLTPTAKELAIL
jgi:Xaa-Pro aminopeptidase